MARGEKKKDSEVKVKKRNRGAFGIIKKQEETKMNIFVAKLIRNSIAVAFILILIFIFVSGKVNQKSFMETLINLGKTISLKIAEVLDAIFSGNGPLEATKDGVYIRK